MEKENTSATNEDMKHLYRSLSNFVKQLDDKRKSITDIKQIFADDIEEIRRQIVAQSENLIFHYDETVGKKSREVLWRKSYYELISLAKNLWLKNEEKDDEKKLGQLITEGIATFKSIIVRMEEENMNDDLRHLIDFSILEDSNGVAVKNALDWNRAVSIGTIHYVNTTVHAPLLSIGDLHRYYIHFNFTDSKFTKEFASRYYLEAFNLNPSIGMAHNQLGTLFSGRNYDLDSTYHYLYSLICSTPFEFSEHNVSKIFLNSSTYVCKLEDGKSSDSVRDFIARFILIADIFERNFIKTQNVRPDLRSLFDNSVKIPLEEDIRLKGFQLLKSTQHPLYWTVPNKLNLTENECHILRLFKLIDFGLENSNGADVKNALDYKTMNHFEEIQPEDDLEMERQQIIESACNINSHNKKFHQYRLEQQKKEVLRLRGGSDQYEQSSEYHSANDICVPKSINDYRAEYERISHDVSKQRTFIEYLQRECQSEDNYFPAFGYSTIQKMETESLDTYFAQLCYTITSIRRQKSQNRITSHGTNATETTIRRRKPKLD